MSRTLLLTGATGTVSTALIDALDGCGLRLRALVRDRAKAEPLRERGLEVVVGDLGSPRSLTAAFDGVDDLWLLVPNGPLAAEHSANAVWAARRADVERVVRLSAIGAAPDAPNRGGRLHAMADHTLARSGLRWSVLRPHWFMQNLLNEAGDVTTRAALRLNMGAARLGMIDARDIAAMAATILTDDPDRHHTEIYTPTGPHSLGFAEVAERLGAVIGRPIDYRPGTDAEVEARLLGYGVSAWITEMLTEYARAYATGWGDFTTEDFTKVTGRRPRELTDFLRDHADSFAT